MSLSSTSHRALMLETSADQLTFLGFTEAREVSDYLQDGEAGFKKPKVRSRHFSYFVVFLLLVEFMIADQVISLHSFPILQKKKKRSTRVAEVDDSEPPVASTSTLPSDSMQVDSPAVAAPPPPPPTENFIDDDELQAALAAARRKKSKKVVKLTPEDIARQREFTFLSQASSLF